MRDVMRWRTAAVGFGVFAIVLANCLWWAAGIPFDGAPDEADHYVLEEFVAQHGRLPHYGEDVFTVHLMDSMTHERLVPNLSPEACAALVGMNHRFELRQTYLFNPQLPYLLAGSFARALGGSSVFKARMFNAIAIALAALCTFLAGWVLWRGKLGLPAVAGLCAGLWPQMTFVGSYVNDDAFAILAVSVLVLACCLEQRDGLDTKRALGLGLGLGLVATSKFYTLAILPLLLVWGLLRWQEGGGRFLRPALLALLVGGTIAVPWFVRNAILYEGDPLGRRVVNRHVQEAAASLTPELRARTKLLGAASPQAQGASWLLLLQRGWFRDTLESFWGRFGWMRARLHSWMYWTALVALLAALALPVSRRVASNAPAGRRRLVPGLFALPLLGILLILSFWNSYSVDYQPQGRYLLVCVPPLSLQLLDGIERRSARLERAAPAFLLCLFALQNLLARLLYLH